VKLCQVQQFSYLKNRCFILKSAKQYCASYFKNRYKTIAM
jgi:hypothetical protein